MPEPRVLGAQPYACLAEHRAGCKAPRLTPYSCPALQSSPLTIQPLASTPAVAVTPPGTPPLPAHPFLLSVIGNAKFAFPGGRLKLKEPQTNTARGKLQEGREATARSPNSEPLRHPLYLTTRVIQQNFSTQNT